MKSRKQQQDNLVLYKIDNDWYSINVYEVNNNAFGVEVFTEIGFNKIEGDIESSFGLKYDYPSDIRYRVENKKTVDQLIDAMKEVGVIQDTMILRYEVVNFDEE